jgi:phage terminase large subunit
MPKKVEMAQEYTVNIPSAYFNPSFLPYLNKIYNYEVYWGGRGSGKSRFIAQKLVMQLSTMSGRNLVAMRKQATDCRNSCFAIIYKTIHKFKLQDMWDIRENPDMRMFNKVTRSEIIFTGMDKAENIKSLEFKEGNATDLWYEEFTEQEVEEEVSTLDNSIRDYDIKCRLIVSFNPPLSTYWIMGWLFNKFKTKTPEITKTGTIKTDVDGVIVEQDFLISHSTYRDNKWNYKIKSNGDADYTRPGQYAAKLEQLKYDDPYKYRTDCLGLPGTAGISVFDANRVCERMAWLENWYVANPPRQVQFSYDLDNNNQPIPSTIKPYNSGVGETLIYFEPNPKHPYVVSIDTAGEGIDPYVAEVMDNVTDDVVAVFRSPNLADECMIQIYGLLMMYNEPLVAPEVNFSDYPILKLREWGYSNFYQREKPVTNRSQGLEKSYGFRTTSGNRQSIIDNLISWTKPNMDKIYDLGILSEMLTFTRQNKKNKSLFMGAESGAHDDRIIALAILLKAKEQQTGEEVAEMKHIEGYWTKGELEAALYKGRVDEDAVREYMLSAEHFQKNNLRRKSRYAR